MGTMRLFRLPTGAKVPVTHFWTSPKPTWREGGEPGTGLVLPWRIHILLLSTIVVLVYTSSLVVVEVGVTSTISGSVAYTLKPVVHIDRHSCGHTKGHTGIPF